MTPMVSKEDEHLLGLGWKATKDGYFRRNWTVDGRRCYEFLHRVVAQALPTDFVDHINGDALDNRRENLRLCTHAENMRNRRRHKNNATGFKGVYPYRGGYRAQVRANGKKYQRGSFATPEEASAAYAEMATDLHGSFARVA